MDKRQKKIIFITLTIIVIIISLSLSIIWLSSFVVNWNGESWKELVQWLFTNFGGLTLGIILKVLINVYNIKKIEKTHESYGLNKKLEKKPEKVKKLDDVDKINQILTSPINNDNKIQEIKKILKNKEK